MTITVDPFTGTRLPFGSRLWIEVAHEAPDADMPGWTLSVRTAEFSQWLRFGQLSVPPDSADAVSRAARDAIVDGRGYIRAVYVDPKDVTDDSANASPPKCSRCGEPMETDGPGRWKCLHLGEIL